MALRPTVRIASCCSSVNFGAEFDVMIAEDYTCIGLFVEDWMVFRERLCSWGLGILIVCAPAVAAQMAPHMVLPSKGATDANAPADDNPQVTLVEGQITDSIGLG